MNCKKPYLVDVPVNVNIWIRPECQKRQFEIIKQARPSILFLQSDGGRNEQEWDAIRKNRDLFEQEVDWNCKIYKIYEDHNLGLYAMWRKTCSFIWEHVDRCIFLEDDYIPSVSYFRYCAELLEKYKDDSRIEMITGNNVFGTYQEAEPNDYFFSETGWSIWGTATWKDRMVNTVYPFEYADDSYVAQCLKDNLSNFWYNKAKRYCDGILVDGHVPGPEYYHAVNSVLYHRLSIIPTKNMICNIGTDGAHANVAKSKNSKDACFFNLPTYEIEFPIKHPEYIIDDKGYGSRYSKKLGHSQNSLDLFIKRLRHAFSLLFQGKLISTIINKIQNKELER